MSTMKSNLTQTCLATISKQKRKSTDKKIRIGVNQFLLMFVFIFIASSCIKVDNHFEKIPPGPWRAVLLLEPRAITDNPKGEYLEEKLNLTFEEVANGELPFTFEVTYTDDTTFYIDLINGEERIRADQISFGHTKSRVKDSIRIDFPIYDSYITGLYENGVIEGQWVVNYREEYSIPFIAHFGYDHRFTKLRKKPVMDLSGKWDVIFSPNNEPYPAVGEFVQTGNHISGTFRTETGDFRFLEGTVQADKAYFSVFDGAHAFLFEAKIDTSTQTLIGSFRSGTHYKTIWQAKRNSEATLTDPDSLTHIIDGGNEFNYNFPDLDGNMHSLNDPALEGKAKIIQIMGTWCPNCRDETAFLIDYLKNNPHDDLEIIGIGFERYKNSVKSIAALRRFKEAMNVPYTILYGGFYDKIDAAKKLPMLNHVLSYPTMVFIGKNNKVLKIHTGFEGPATQEYQRFKDNFAKTVDLMLRE